MNKKYKGTRQIVSTEVVEVYAKNYTEAMMLIEDDDNRVRIIYETDGDYEVVGKLEEINE